MVYSIDYYSSGLVSEIDGWPPGIQADYARTLELLMESGPAVPMPHSRAMGGGLFELRARGREGIGRALYCFRSGQRIVILCAFIKTTRTTPRRLLDLARRRMAMLDERR